MIRRGCKVRLAADDCRGASQGQLKLRVSIQQPQPGSLPRGSSPSCEPPAGPGSCPVSSSSWQNQGPQADLAHGPAKRNSESERRQPGDMVDPLDLPGSLWDSHLAAITGQHAEGSAGDHHNNASVPAEPFLRGGHTAAQRMPPGDEAVHAAAQDHTQQGEGHEVTAGQAEASPDSLHKSLEVCNLDLHWALMSHAWQLLPVIKMMHTGSSKACSPADVCTVVFMQQRKLLWKYHGGVGNPASPCLTAVRPFQWLVTCRAQYRSLAIQLDHWRVAGTGCNAAAPGPSHRRA